MVTIANSDLTLTLDPQRGASITAFRFQNGDEIMRTCTDNTHEPRTTACFPLLPTVGRICNASFEWFEKSYRLSPNMLPEPHYIHGEGWLSTAWQIVEQQSEKVTVALQYQTGNWPFAFTAHLTYTLQNNLLRGEITIKNNEPLIVPIGIGFHPYFPKTKYSKMITHAQCVMLVDNDGIPTDIVRDDPLLLHLNNGTILQQVLDNCFSQWSQRCVLEQERHTVTLSSHNLPCLHCYVPDEDCFCIEPVSHFPNAINMHHPLLEENMTTVRPQETISASFTLLCEKK